MSKKKMSAEEYGSSQEKWPSVQQQLERDHVTKGSELEKLIMSNQDVELLRPEEHPNDNVGLPLWIRVHWRKNHPDQKLSKTPLGDYPDVLFSTYSWMLAHHDLNKSKVERQN